MDLEVAKAISSTAAAAAEKATVFLLVAHVGYSGLKAWERVEQDKFILCQFESGFLLYNFQLGDDMTTDFLQNTYFFNTWYETDTLEYSVTNPESAQSAVLVRQLIPYLAITIVVTLCLGTIYKRVTKRQQENRE